MNIYIAFHTGLAIGFILGQLSDDIFPKSKPPHSSRNYLFDRNIISFRAGDIISLCPPLSITKDEIDFLIEALTSAIVKVEKEI